MTGQGDLLIRRLVGTVLGAVIGYERHLHGRPAGLRTHLLVGLASTTFMLVSTHFVYFQPYTREDLVSVDTARIAAALTVLRRVERKEDDILRRRVPLEGSNRAVGVRKSADPR
jgi:uncharacterized membrane protein YhiD involved in acid resistance